MEFLASLPGFYILVALSVLILISILFYHNEHSFLSLMCTAIAILLFYSANTHTISDLSNHYSPIEIVLGVIGYFSVGVMWGAYWTYKYAIQSIKDDYEFNLRGRDSSKSDELDKMKQKYKTRGVTYFINETTIFVVFNWPIGMISQLLSNTIESVAKLFTVYYNNFIDDLFDNRLDKKQKSNDVAQ